jgi:putative transposase
MILVVPHGLRRYCGADDLHFITCSCYRRPSFLRSARSRDLLLSEQGRDRYHSVVVGYVVMPEHIHLLLSEPGVGTLSTVMQVLKQRTARALLPKLKRRDAREIKLFGDSEASVRAPFWQTRFYDFNVWTNKKCAEKLRYMHDNPVKRGLGGRPRIGARAVIVTIFSTRRDRSV